MTEEFSDMINRILRDHQGYTGDGHGGVGDLPVGDRSTAHKPINKRDLRAALLAYGDIVDDAALSAAQAALFAGPRLDSQADIETDTSLSNDPESPGYVPVGGYVTMRDGGGALQRVESDGDRTTSGEMDLNHVSSVGTIKRPARAAGDDSVEINKIIQRHKKDRNTAYLTGCESEVIDFGNKVARIENPIIGATGIKLQRINFIAAAEMTSMIKTEGVDDFRAALDADKYLHQEYFFGFIGECSVNAKGFNMTSGRCVDIACDWGQIDHLTIAGLDDSDDILPNVTCFHWAAKHPPAPRNYFAETKIGFLKTARASGGAFFDAVDAILDTYIGQAHTDFGLWEDTAVDLGFAHIYGALPSSFPAGASDRGYGYVANAKFGGVRRTKVIELETCQHGFVFADSFSYSGKFELHVYKNFVTDVTAVAPATQMSVDMSVSDGARAGGEGASQRGRGNAIYLPSGIKFVDSNIDLVGYGGCLDFQADRSEISGNFVARSRTADGLEASIKIPPYIRGVSNRISGVLHGQFGLSNDQDFNLAGTGHTVDLTCADGDAAPNIRLGYAGNPLQKSNVKLHGTFTRQPINIGASCDISSGAGANHGPTIVSASSGVIDLLTAENAGLHPSYQVDTDASAVTLSNITNAINGQVIELSPTSASNGFTLTHGSRFKCPGGVDLVVPDRLSSVKIKYIASIVAWRVLRSSINS